MILIPKEHCFYNTVCRFLCVTLSFILVLLKDSGLSLWLRLLGSLVVICFLFFFFCSSLFWLFGGPATHLPSNSHTESILSYECSAWIWLVSSQLSLSYLSHLPIASGLLPLSVSVDLPSFSMACCIAGFLAPDVPSLFYFAPPFLPDFSSYLFSLPASPFYPFFCLAIGHSALC